MNKRENVTQAKQKASYTKAQFLASKKFTPVQKDLLNVLLKDDQKYTNEQVQKLIGDFRKKEVK